MNRATATPVSVPIILNINKNVTRLSNYGMYLFHFSLIKWTSNTIYNLFYSIHTYQLHCSGGTLPQNFISKHAHVHSDLISVAEIKYRFYIYRIYFWTAEEAHCMKITCPLHLPVQCHSSEYNPPMLWHWHSVQQCSMSPPWSTCHHGPHCMSKLGAMGAPVPDCGGRWRGLERIVTTALGLGTSAAAGRRRWFYTKKLPF